MKSNVRVSLVALIVSASVAFVAAPAAQAAFGIKEVFAANCKVSTCGEFPEFGGTPLKNSELFTQAAGHPAAGITAFKVNTEGTFPNEAPEGVATGGIVTHVRTDVGVGVSTNPEAVAKCSFEEFDNTEVAPGFFLEPKCKAASEIGVNKVVVWAGPEPSPKGGDVPIVGKVYNLEQPTGLASDFGAALKLPLELTEVLFKGTQLEKVQLYSHTLIEGSVEWGAQAQGTEQADYHDYYEITVSPTLPLISSRLTLNGEAGTTGKGGFITNPSSCSGTGPQTTTTVSLTPKVGETAKKGYAGPLGTEGCKGEGGLLVPPFEPAFKLTPSTTQLDQPDGITTELELPHSSDPKGIDTSQLETATIKLPEGMTLNPSAAGEVTEACTVAEARIKSPTFGVTCPAKSTIGTVSLEVPTLPPGSLTGNVYLGGPLPPEAENGPIVKPPYTIYVNAQSTRYGVDVRLQGSVVPNETTGQLTATFSKNPQQPFSNIKLKFNSGALAPIANPLVCGSAKAETSLAPYIGSFATKGPSSSFAVDGNGAGGGCASPLPFSLSQSTVNQPPGNAGAKTSYTLNVERGEGQQYLSQIKTTLPEGLVGLIPSVPLCGEPQASKGECSPASQIGVVGVKAGSGAPYGFSGQIYLTGPYGGAPYGLAIETSAKAGPFDLGSGPCNCVLSRGTLNVDPYTARVTATTNLPTIVKGVPLRLRQVTVNMNRQGFLINPTNCGVLATETTLTSTFGAEQKLSTPFQVGNCKALAFKPKFGSATSAKTSKANGASLETTINMPTGDANIKSVLVQLPKQLPSRLTTLQKACPEKTFANNYNECPPGSFVGGASANTPTLPGKLSGPAILVSHGGQAFPDLDLVMNANGVRVILVGNTNIKNGITTTNFATPPDVPVSSITVNLPVGPHSALTANGNLCANKLVMPTTMVGQNGTTFKQSTTIKVNNCPVRIVGKKVIGDTAYLSVQTYSAGRISGKGADLATVFRSLKGAVKSASLKVSLSNAGRHRGRPFSTKVRVGFVPKKKGAPSSVAYTTVRFG
ncbi:MAG TPA: hypothetical protein VGI24_08190 [Solirubrobacteraceae bacterium]